jgi:hypothetical protein
MLDKLINQTWKTTSSAQTDDRGTLSFRGVWGKYEITLNSPDGKICVFPAHVRRNEDNKWVFTVEGYGN